MITLGTIGSIGRIGGKPKGGSKVYTMLLTSIGNGSAVAPLVMDVSSNITVTLTGSARFYTDSAGTLNASTTWNLTAGGTRTIYLRVPSGESLMAFSDITKLTRWGGLDQGNGWNSVVNSCHITASVAEMVNLRSIRITQNCTLPGQLPSTLTYLRIYAVTLGHTGALPAGLTYLYLYGTNWVYNGNMPLGLTYIYLLGGNIDWTGLNIGSGSSVGITLSNFRISKMSSADMVTLLNQMRTRIGAISGAVTINDYADYAAPPAAVTDAVAALRAAKTNITSVTLGA
jgi:hypothetical protein